MRSFAKLQFDLSEQEKLKAEFNATLKDKVHQSSGQLRAAYLGRRRVTKIINQLKIEIAIYVDNPSRR